MGFLNFFSYYTSISGSGNLLNMSTLFFKPNNAL